MKNLRPFLFAGSKIMGMNEDVLINPIREKGEQQIPGTGILCINPADARFLIKKAEEGGGKRHFIYNSKLFVVHPKKSNKGYFIAGPAVGAPMAVMILEKLIALGAKKIVISSWCGSLSPTLKTGHVLLPTWGISEEGTSQHYPINSRPESSAKLLEKLQSALAKNEIPCQKGPIWTTDAVYRETRAKIAKYQQKSVLGVDMEFSALATVAKYRGIELAAAMLISDQLWGDEWQPGFSGKGFREKSRRFQTSLFNLISE